MGCGVRGGERRTERHALDFGVRELDRVVVECEEPVEGRDEGLQ